MSFSSLVQEKAYKMTGKHEAARIVGDKAKALETAYFQ